MDENFKWMPQVFLRAPLYSLSEFSRENLAIMMKTALFQNALYLASPVFFKIIAEKDFDVQYLTAKELNGLLKYFNRMCFRPTPFGAFASFTLAGWSEGRHIVLSDLEKAVLHLLPSQDMVMRALQTLPEPAGDEMVILNPTAYLAGNTIRFIKSQGQSSGKLQYLLTAIPAEKLNIKLFEFLKGVRCMAGEILSFLREATHCAVEEAQDYLNFLLEEQLVYGRKRGDIFEIADSTAFFLYPSAGQGHQFTVHTWPSLVSVPVLETGLLAEVAERWADRTLNGAGVPVKGIFYGALERPLMKGGSPATDQEELWKALEILSRLMPERREPPLDQFKKAFKARFDLEKVPLLKALDPDIGIAFGEINALSLTPDWVREMNFVSQPVDQDPVQLTSLHQLFLRKWLSNPARRPGDQIEILEADLSDVSFRDRESQFPPSLAVMFSHSDEHIILDMVGGVSAASLIGRFSVFSDEVEHLSHQIVQGETSANPDVIFADIAQLSDNHVDNINRRRPVYDYYIPVNTFSKMDTDHEISLRDLWVSIRGNELILESASLNKRIIPRLSTAYNIYHNDLGIFRFLAELQYQGLTFNFTLDLEKLFPGLVSYPRVVFQKVILSVAKWHFEEADIIGLTSRPLSLGRLHLFRQHHHLPPQLTMGNGDQQLTFDLSDDDQAIFFLTSISGLKAMILKEFLPPDQTVRIGTKIYGGQYVACLQKDSKTYQGLISNEAPGSIVPRSFVTGSDWLYLKIYSTPIAADEFLTEIAAPVLGQFRAQIHCWFFVRYADPESHLRLRINISNTEIGSLLIAFKNRIDELGFRELIREYGSGTYQRELERYPGELIDEIETCFFKGSELFLQCMVACKEEGNDADPLLLAMVMANQMAKCFWVEEDALATFVSARASAMSAEYRNPKQLKKEFDLKYREISASLERALGGPFSASFWTSQSQALFDDLLAQTKKIASQASDLSLVKKQLLIGDLIHMQLNRVFSVAQRQQETFVFHCLTKFQRSQVAKKRKTSAKT